MSCEYIKVTDKFGRIRLEELSSDTIINVEPGDKIFINELTSNIQVKMITDNNDLLIKLPDGTQITLKNILSLLAENEEGGDKVSLFDDLLTKLQFLNQELDGEITYAAMSDIYSLLDSAAAGSSEILENDNVVDFGNVNTEHARRNFREDTVDEHREFDTTSSTSVETDDSSTNNAPILNVQSTAIVDEDGSANITFNTSDSDGIIVSTTASVPVEQGTVTVNGDGTITFIPAANFNGEATITVTTTDDDGAIVIQTSAITVNDINDAPTLTVESTKSVDEDGTTSITFTAADIDGTVTTTATAQHGTVTVNENGTISYTPEANYNGADTITVTTTDDDGAIVIQTSAITVNDINDAPVITVVDTTVTEDVSQVIANVSDIDGTIANSSLSAENGTVTISDNGDITYTPNADFNGTDSVTVLVTDNDGATTTQVISVDVVSANDGPDAVDDTIITTAYEIPEGGEIVSSDGDTAVVRGEIVSEGEALSSVDHWKFSHNGGALTIDTLTESGSNFIDIDGDGEKDHIDTMMRLYDSSGNLIIVSDDSNQGTQDGSTNDYYSHIQDSYISIDDLPAGEYTLSIGSWELTDAEVQNDQNDNSNFGREYHVEQDLGPYQISFTGDISFEHSETITTDEDTSLTINAIDLLSNDTDIDGDILTINSVQDASHGTVSLDDNGNVVFTPDANYNGEATFTYTISDGNGGEDTATVTLNVESVNDAPTITVVDTAVTEDVSQIIATTSDIDGTIDSSSLSATNGTVTITDNGDITYTPNANFNGTDTVTVSVTDNEGGTTTQTISVDVASVNDGPDAVDDSSKEGEILVSENFENGAFGWSNNTVTETNGEFGDFLGRFGGTSGTEGVSKTFDFGTEHTGQTVTIEFDMYEIDSWDGESFKVFTNNNEVSSESMFVDSHYGERDGGVQTANNEFTGWGQEEVHHYSIQATVDENGQVKLGFGSTLNQSIADESWGIDNVTITSGNDWIITTDEDTFLTIDANELLANDTDVDGDTLSIISVQDASHGTVSLDANGNVVFSPDANYNGEATFTYTIIDGQGGNDISTVTLNVESVNDVPVITVVNTTVTEDVSQVIAIASDIEGTIESSSLSATNGTVTIADNGDITYTPNANFNGTDSVTLTVTDNEGGTTTQAISVDVGSVNDGPEAVDDSTTSFLPENATLAGELTFDTGSGTTGPSGSTSGQVNEAGVFSSNATVMENLDLDSSYGAKTTITMWFKHESQGSDWEMLAGSDHHDLTFYGNNLGFNTWQSDLYGFDATEFNDGEWHQITAVFTNGNVTQNEIYIDGVEQSLGQVMGSPYNNNAYITNDGNDITIGGETREYGSFNFNGSIDEVKVFNGELSSDEIQTLFDIESAGNNYVEGSLSTNEDSTITVDVLANDTDLENDVLSITEVQGQDVSSGQTVNVTNDSGTVLGTAAVVDGKIMFTPGDELDSLNADENQDVSFAYTISDGAGGTDSADVTINVTGLTNDPDAVNDITISTAESLIYIVDSSKNLGTVNLETQEVNVIGNTGQTLTDIAYDNNGSLFGIGFGQLYSIDSETAQTTFIANLGLGGSNALEIAQDGTAYIASYADNGLYELDLTNGTVTKIVDLPIKSGGDIAIINNELYIVGDKDSHYGNDTLVKVNLSDNSVTEVGTMTHNGQAQNIVYGLTSSPDGKLYAIDENDIYEVNPLSAVMSMSVENYESGLGVAWGADYAPTVESSITTDEDSSITVDVLSNDTNIYGNVLSISKIQGQDVNSGQTVNVTNDSGEILGSATVVEGKIVFTPGDELDSLNVGENQDVTFAYTISDGHGGTDSADVTINVQGTAVDVGEGDDEVNTNDVSGRIDIDMGSGDDTFRFLDDMEEDSNIIENSLIDFGEGFDTLIIEDDIVLHFDNLILDGSENNQISNLEVINMQNGTGANKLENLDISDVLHMTDDVNLLKIVGDSGDEIGLNIAGDDALWTKSDTKITEEGEEFDVWTSNSNDLTVYIDDDITITDI